MLLPEYASPRTAAPLVDATSWLADELFWPAYLLYVGMSRLTVEAFDVDLPALSAYLNDFDRPEMWPVFPVPVAGGTLHVVVRNDPDDAGIDWVLDETVRAAVAGLPAARPGPGLPWPLLPQDPRHLLLALPAFGDDQVPAGARNLVVLALRAVGARRVAGELADDLLQRRACVTLR